MNEPKAIPLVPVTILILTNRRDERFRRCLASAQFAQEIIVFDNESKNNWIELTRSLRFTLIPTSGQINDFADIRNRAIQHASHQWVLFLDSDEYLPDEAASAVAKMLHDNLYEGIRFRRLDTFLGKTLQYGEAGTTYIIRLARKRQLRYSGAVHEVPHIPGSVGDSPVPIFHESHTSISEFIADVSRYAHLASTPTNQSMAQTIAELLTFPPAKFLMNYVFKLGFLDGWQGLVYAWCMSFHSFLVRLYRIEQLQEARR